MANRPDPQPDIKFCPVCKSSLKNIPRSKMKSKGYIRRDVTVSDCRYKDNLSLIRSSLPGYFLAS